MELNDGQRAAVEAVRSGQNVFLTGEGGTGKSVALREAVAALEGDGRKVAVCAPTGVAAQAVGGATLHSVFGFGLGPKVADALDAVRPSRVVREADAVVIDEVGMVRRDLMDAVARVVAAENEARAAAGRGPLQLVAVGDFSQLPPVVTAADRPALAAHYGPGSASTGFYAFEADGWGAMGFRVCQLTEPMRQADPVFVGMLNRARVGDRSCLPYFNHLARRPVAPPEAVSIVSRNKDAERVNLARLEALSGPGASFQGTVWGKFGRGDMAAPETLELKEGARVICVASDRDAGFVNGSTGTVVSTRRPLLGPESVIVRLDSGRQVAVTRRTWENVAYSVVDDGGRKRLEQTVLGTFTQFPLKLAWAVTYHKAQGQTLGAVSIDPEAFGPGMLYVGLSRATSAAGVWLTREIDPSWLMADESVVRFYELSCGWVPPAPATGDEVPDLPEAHEARRRRCAGGPRPKAEPAAPRDGEGQGEPTSLDAVQEELHKLLGHGGRTWTRVYELIDLVRREGLYRPGHRSFSAWMRDEARREGVAESVLWHRKSAGDFYNEWADGKPDAPGLRDGAGLSEDNLNLVRKIAALDPGRGDELMREMVEGGLSTQELRREWRGMRAPAEPDRPAPARHGARASRAALSVECADAATFDALVEAARAAGIDVELL